MIIDEEAALGSTAYARMTADHCEEFAARRGEIIFSVSDLEQIARWARAHAGRHVRRAKVAGVAATIGLLTIAGARDGNRNGRADVLDYAAVTGITTPIVPAAEERTVPQKKG